MQFDILVKKKVVHISCGAAFTVVIIDNGEVYGWGNNRYGQLGVGDMEDRTTPCQVDSLIGTVIVQVVCGDRHTLALTDKGDLYAWGLLDLADAYCESDLRKKCFQMLKKEITVPNVVYLYTIAVKYNEEELEDCCVRFAVHHMNAVTMTEDFAKLEQELMMTSFIIKARRAGCFKY
ncbi:RCC1 and BTB domain-containing protein 1 [Trachymyrmex zeteki]|uniref:RCC1 and BTB domain-containing protein 1 n=1 Tax=Mycetomoellerius zeteki TaxID=64791 RepID=A0A151WP45_9HYME|nr:RCC1 and BTB domain-containing protein 1 [Trachymyrmex zeteki]